MSKIQMGFIERRLTELYIPHINVDDRPFQNADEQRKAKLSAALAALALQARMGCDIETACASVVDGTGLQVKRSCAGAPAGRVPAFESATVICDQAR